jgi:hypothetical protein
MKINNSPLEVWTIRTGHHATFESEKPKYISAIRIKITPPRTTSIIINHTIPD